MQRDLAVLTVVGAVLVLGFSGHGLWYPAETTVAEGVASVRPLDALVTSAGLSVFGETAFGARVGHGVLGLAGVLVIWCLAHPTRRARWYTVAALVGSPAWLLAARSAAGGIVIVVPVALSAWGFIDHLRTHRRRSLVAGVVGSWLAALASGVVGCAIPLVTTVILAPTIRRRGTILASIAASVVALLGGLVLARALDTPFLPGAPESFADGLDRLVLGLFPLAICVPFVFTVSLDDVERRCWLAHATAWCVATVAWPHDPWIALAPSVPLAILVGRALDDVVRDDEPRPLLAAVLGLISLGVARAFQLSPEQLVAPHVEGLDTPARLGSAGWLMFAGFAAGAIAAALRRWRPVAIAIALGCALGITARAAFVGGPQTSRASSPAELVALASSYGLPLEAGLGTAGRFMLVEEVASVEALVDHLATPPCRAAVVATKQFVALHRLTRGRSFVLGEPRAGLQLVASCLPPGAVDRNPLVTGMPAAIPDLGTAVDAEWAEAIQLIAADVAPQVSTATPELPITLVYRIVAPPPPRAIISLRLDGCNDLYSIDHPVLDGAVATDMLRPGDIVIDRSAFDLLADAPPPCTYRLTTGWRANRRPLPVTRGRSDESGRVEVGRVTVVPAAPRPP